MASTYSNSGIELITTGEQSGTWGTTTNNNLQIIDRLISGVGSITLSGTTHTLTTSDGALSDGQYGLLVFGGSPSGTNTVTISPNDSSKIYLVRNTTAQSVVLSQGSGSTVTVPAGKGAIVYTDGAGATAAVSDLTSTFSFATLTGTETLTNKTLTSPTVNTPTISGATLNDGYTEEVFAITDGTTVNLDPNNGSIQTWTLGANRTPGQANWAAGQSITLMVDDGSAATVTWTSLAVTWKTDGGSAPTLNTTGFTVIQLWKVSTTIYGARVGDA